MTHVEKWLMDFHPHGWPMYILTCDWLPAGSESGRSSPYYGQEGRPSTPTKNQPPKHFHVPGRSLHLLIALLTNSLGIDERVAAIVSLSEKVSFILTTMRTSNTSVLLYSIWLQWHILPLTLHLHSSPPFHHLLLFLLISTLHLLFLSSATGEPNIYRKPPIYKRAGTVQLAPP